jgi:hypothetical protein
MILEVLAAGIMRRNGSRIDGEELAMAANGGSQMERNAGGFGRKPTDTWGEDKLGCREEKIRKSKGREQQVRM